MMQENNTSQTGANEAEANEQANEAGSVHDILHEMGSAQANLLVGFQVYLSELANERKLPPEEDHEALDPGVRQKLLLDRKVRQASERRQQVKDEYTKL